MSVTSLTVRIVAEDKRHFCPIVIDLNRLVKYHHSSMAKLHLMIGIIQHVTEATLALIIASSSPLQGSS